MPTEKGTRAIFNIGSKRRPTVTVQALTTNPAAAPAGGTGAAAGGWDTAGNRDAAITTINSLRTRVSEIETLLQDLGLLT